jgi:hypothetical protein
MYLRPLAARNARQAYVIATRIRVQTDANRLSDTAALFMMPGAVDDLDAPR